MLLKQISHKKLMSIQKFFKLKRNNKFLKSIEVTENSDGKYDVEVHLHKTSEVTEKCATIHL